MTNAQLILHTDTTRQNGVAVRLEGLWKTYKEAVAVRDVNLTVEPGEFVTLLGPSGSGKTTTLMMIAGFVEPTHGEIYINNREVAQLPAQRRNLGMVFQHYALFPHMTVAQNVAFPLEMRRMPRAEIARRVMETLKLVRLEGYDERFPRQLSGGQQQRIAMARAIVFEPDVLLMDEPLGALDKSLREQMQWELRRIHRELGVTVFYVTHDQEEALTMSDRIVVMRDGGIEQVGTPRDLYERPANAFIASFIGVSNLINGVVAGPEVDGLQSIQLANDQVIRATTRARFAKGDPVVVSVRPESLSLSTAIDRGQNCNSLGGHLSELIYAGDVTRVKVDVGATTLILSEPNSTRRTWPEAGAPVAVTWPHDQTSVLPADAVGRAAG